jgi:hypothetical protein
MDGWRIEVKLTIFGELQGFRGGNLLIFMRFWGEERRKGRENVMK